jgi:hypothetical protein
MRLRTHALHAHTHMHARAHTHTHTCRHAHARAHTHTQTHARARTCSCTVYIVYYTYSNACRVPHTIPAHLWAARRTPRHELPTAPRWKALLSNGATHELPTHITSCVHTPLRVTDHGSNACYMLYVACYMLSMEGCMLPAADAVVLSDYGSNGCPTGHARITSESECARAAAAIGQPFDGTETLPTRGAATLILACSRVALSQIRPPSTWTRSATVSGGHHQLVCIISTFLSTSSTLNCS